ncbi:magnesium chelatase subunit D [Parasphingorhabdus sp.]|uniref:magnesium chelatase subunit D n=1 Tax=Parasphingorhabdus sp. TaxID=2709688 RepID=UPI003A8FE712
MNTGAEQETAPTESSLADCLLAARFFAQNPFGLSGICLRGFGPVRDALVEKLISALEPLGPVLKVPNNVDAERLLGGIDLAATLQGGRSVWRPGLLETAQKGFLLVPMAERIDENIAAHIAQAMDIGELAIILLDDGMESDEAPPAVLMERIAFHCDLTGARDLAAVATQNFLGASAATNVRSMTKKRRASLAATAAAFGIHSVRPLLFAERCATLHAAMAGRDRIDDEDLQIAVRLVLGPRASQFPQQEESSQPQEQEPNPPDQESEESEDQQNIEDVRLEDLLLDAAAASIPPHILDQIEGKVRPSGKGQGGRAGSKQQSTKRGRPKGTRPGVPGNGKRLALIDTLRTAAPWQTIRRRESGNTDPGKIHIRKADLRVHHYEDRQESLTIFAVDASGSSALSRLAEAKGAVELMLAEAYVKRSQVALVAFRKEGAEVLLPSTRSLTRARRALNALPGGGGTPLAAGLVAARQLAEAARKRGQTPTIAMLTDGKGNVMLDGTANRQGAKAEMEEVAKGIAALGLNSIVIDISPRPRPEAAELAAALRGRYLPLPRAQSAAMVAAIESVGKETAA